MTYSAEVDAILAEFRACETVEQIKQVALKHRDYVRSLDKDPALSVRAIHIRHLAEYRRAMIEKDERKNYGGIGKQGNSGGQLGA